MSGISDGDLRFALFWVEAGRYERVEMGSFMPSHVSDIISVCSLIRQYAGG